MLSAWLQCCNRASSTELKVLSIGGFQDDDNICCRRVGDADPKIIDISSDVLDGHSVDPVHLLTSPDPFAQQVEVAARLDCDHDRLQTLTQRQQSLKEQVRLPLMMRYPVPLHCSPEDPEEVRIAELLRTFQVFVLDMHKGVYMTQVTTTDEYSDIHCQLLDDLQTLKVDQGSSCIVEFPLTAVTRIYRVVRNDGKVFSGGSPTGPVPMPPLPLVNAEHIVVVEFMKRKLVLVFGTMSDAQSFIMCMELLVRFAQEVATYDSHGRDQQPWPHHARSGEAAWSGAGLSGRNSHTDPVV
jgi:hypothetical protein